MNKQFISILSPFISKYLFDVDGNKLRYSGNKVEFMKSILLVEDDPFLIDIYTTKLKEAGFEISVAEDGEEAIMKIQEKEPDLLLLDIILPHTDGWEILEKIKKEQAPRKREQKLKGFKVVVLSNLGEKEDIEKGMRLGADKYLVKAHLTPSEVVEEIKKILKRDSLS